VETRGVVPADVLPFACGFNPDWSLAGKRIVYDRIEGGSQQLYVADLRSGTTAAVVGAPSGANNGSFSPNGHWLAFDQFVVGDPTIYVLPVSQRTAAGWRSSCHPLAPPTSGQAGSTPLLLTGTSFAIAMSKTSCWRETR
jgi:Tol biopolymer transport system component